MNIKFIALFSFSFVTGVNSISRVDQYEYTRQELEKCRNNRHWIVSSLICANQQVAFDKAREHLYELLSHKENATDTIAAFQQNGQELLSKEQDLIG